MNIQRQKTHRLLQMPPRQWWAAPTAFIATLLALPVNAGITVPDEPLTTGVRVAPNVMFILDDSGSMSWDYMPDDVPVTSNPNVSGQAYTRNTLSYNPATSYSAWTQADGNLMTGGASYSAAYGSFNKVGGSTIDLGNSSSCGQFNSNYDSTTDEPTGTDWRGNPNGTVVCGGVQTFYVPQDVTRTDEAYLGNGKNYYRYQILSGGSDIMRGIYGKIVASSRALKIDNSNPDTGTLSDNNSIDNKTESVSSGVKLGIGIENNSDSCGQWWTGCTQPELKYWVYDPSGAQVCSGNVSRGNSDTSCSIDSAAAGQYKITVKRGNGSVTKFRLTASASTTNSCDGSMSNGSNGWINCTSTLPNPSKRDTVAKELINYATWFSYHRTRMKAAKAGASLAFAGMDSRVRVGFRTIWGRNAFDIPVGDGNDGRFVNNPDDPSKPGDQSTTSRSQWYAKLFGVIGYNGTPLHDALKSAGDYFKDSRNTGPYGPESGQNQYTCRQNFAILTTDGYWNGAAATGIGNADGSDGSAIGKPPSGSYKYVPAAPYKDEWSSYSWTSNGDSLSVDATLADVAMHYWKTDLRTEDFMGNVTKPTGNNVPTSDDDPAFWQHMVTFGISIGLSGTVDQATVKAVKDNGGPTVNGVAGWPKPKANTATAIDDLLHAAVNGHGTFLAATNPTAFAAGLKEALSTISKRTSSYSNVATNSSSLRSGSKIFNASYESGVWSGDVKAYTITASGVASTASWSANFPSWSSRKIYTAGGTFPTLTQTASLDRSTVGLADYPVTGTENANYIKGDRSLEGSELGDLRERTSLLGDIVGSSPEYVEDTNTLYVGSNDGMLHAFNAANGTEQFAYVPGILDMSVLRNISRGDYATMHKFFVDGPIVVSPRSLTPNKNILVGSLGKGGKGIFALNVTDVSTLAGAGNTTSPTLWEKTSADTDYGNLGLVLGKPILAKAKTGATVAVISNGVNSANDKATLLVVDLADGHVIREIDTGEGSSGTPNGLFSPTGVLGPDGSLDYVYAGDMLGNLWRFDLKSTDESAWSKTRLFTAKASGGTGAAQPITSGVTIATDPRTFKRWVFFGTGRFLTTTDAADKTANAQGMYGIIDDGTSTAVAYANLSVRSLTGAGATRTADTKAELAVGKEKGWYITLPGAGERIVQDAQVVSNVLVTSSMLPTGDGCGGGGGGYVNAVDAFTGTSTGSSFFDTNGDGTIDSNDAVVGSMDYGVGMPTLPIIFPGRIVVGGTGGGSGGGAGAPGGGKNMSSTWNRVSWIEVRQD